MSTLYVDNLAPNLGSQVEIPQLKPLAGSVINVWEARKTDTQSTSGFTFVDVTGLSITLTPTSASSKFLINYNVRASSNFYATYINLLRNGTVLFNEADGAGDGRLRVTSQVVTEATDSNTHGIMHPHSVTLLDSPNTTSSVTYKIQTAGRNPSYIGYINRSVPDRTSGEFDLRAVSNIVIQEIAG